MTTHVFIVDKTTFKLHLEHLFVGTGAKENRIDFNNCSDTVLHHKTENMLVEMIADASRIRKGDLIIFYLQQKYQQKIFEGKFYGIFRALENGSFLDNNDREQYLRDELGKSLTFRTLIEPYKVYAEGVTEWEALDEIKYIQSPNQMLWSLIYRKLKAKRGNTMITIYESERLFQLIRNKNNKTELDICNRLLSFDIESQKIICLQKQHHKHYQGRREEINILPRLIRKFDEKKSFEAHLQAYIVKNIEERRNSSLDNTILGESTIEWLGNEVYCGVGMQKIDVMLSIIKRDQRVVMPVELKSCQADQNSVRQIQRYVDWIKQYYIPNRQSDIQPVLISKANSRKSNQKHKKLIEKFNEFNRFNKPECEKLKYIEFDVQDKNLVFEQVLYNG